MYSRGGKKYDRPKTGAHPLSIQRIGWEKPAANNTLQYEYQPISNSLWFTKLVYLEQHFLKDPYLGFSILSRSRISGLNTNHASVIYKRLYKPFVSSVRSTYSHPDLLLITTTTTPLFQITPVLNTGLSLSEPLQLYKGYNAI